MKSLVYLSIFAVLVFTLSASAIQDVHAVMFTGSQTGPGEWTYNLTYNTVDNFSVCQPSTTITLTNLAGVIGAYGPTSTDLPANLPGALDWIPAVSNGGTVVVWTHNGSGTGNFPIDKHVFGFKVIANATNGTVNVATDGFAKDTRVAVNPCLDLDINMTTSGPTVKLPIPKPICKFSDPKLCQTLDLKEPDICIVNNHLICKVNFDILREIGRCYDKIDGPGCPLPITKETLLEIQHEFPPLKQVNAGVPLKDIVPTTGQVLIIDDHRTSPISVTQKTAEMLMSRDGSTWKHFP